MAEKKIIIVGSDHAGYSLKLSVLECLRSELSDLTFEDVGCYGTDSVHYPEYAAKVAEAVSEGKGRGILFCGSGIGVAITANKFANVRAATLWDQTSARLTRQHNDANIACVGERLIGPEVACDILRTFLTTSFEGGRHQKRVDLIHSFEQPSAEE